MVLLYVQQGGATLLQGSNFSKLEGGGRRGKGRREIKSNMKCWCKEPTT